MTIWNKNKICGLQNIFSYIISLTPVTKHYSHFTGEENESERSCLAQEHVKR